jgi:hypothetical protein
MTHGCYAVGAVRGITSGAAVAMEPGGGALLQAGFTVTAIDYPRPQYPSGWSTNEAAIPPFIVIKAIK